MTTFLLSTWEETIKLALADIS